MFNYLSIVAGLGYIILGIAVIAYKVFFIPLEEYIALTLGCVMIVYGVFRIWRAIYKIKRNHE